MRLIKPYTESINLDLNNPNSILKHIEVVGRNCYKSEEKIKDDSYIAFVKMLINRGHFAMLEHNLIPIEISGKWAHECYYSLQRLDAKLQKETLDTYDVRFINFTSEQGKYIISANLRVFRDLYTFYPDNIFIQHITKHLCDNGYKIIFEGLDVDCLDLEETISINFDIIKDTIKLTPMERLYHEFKSIRFVCDRGISHELVRHRVAAFAQESTRFCNYGKGEHITFIIPSFTKLTEGIYHIEYGDYVNIDNETPNDESANAGRFVYSCYNAESNYNTFIKEGWIPGQARAVLPNSLKTDIIMTMNLRGWKHFFDMRLPQTAHEQMRELTIPLYEKEFKNLFENMKN